MNVKGDDPTGAPRRTQAERSEATRAALIGAGRRLFAERGYAELGTEEIVRAAGVTRGALYHHFEGKRELFEAVYEQIEAELAERIAAGALGGGAEAPLEAMRAGTEMLLAACTEREVQQIALLDAPAVLGWDRWREIAARYGLGLIEATLQAAIDAGEVRRAAGPAARPRADGRRSTRRRCWLPGRRTRRRRAPRSGRRSTPCWRRWLPMLPLPRACSATGESGSATGASLRRATRRDSFCAYMRRSASCIASSGVSASAGTVTVPQEDETSTPFLRAVSAIAASRLNLPSARSGSGQEDAELVAPDPVGAAAAADDRGQPLTEFGEQLVAGRVAAGVVEALEAVEVEEDHGDRVVFGRFLAEAFEVDLQGASAAEAGQRVGSHLGEQLLVLADADREPGDHRGHRRRPEHGREAAARVQGLDREEPDHHGEEEGGDHQLAPAVETGGGVDLGNSRVCQAWAPRQAAAIR